MEPGIFFYRFLGIVFSKMLNIFSHFFDITNELLYDILSLPMLENAHGNGVTIVRGVKHNQ